MLAAQLSWGVRDWPVAPLAGAVLPKAPGATSRVVKLHQVPPSAGVVLSGLTARTCQ